MHVWEKESASFVEKHNEEEEPWEKKREKNSKNITHHDYIKCELLRDV